MGMNFLSGLVSGVTSAVCWISFCLVFGWENLKAVGLGALILLVVTTAVSTVIANVVSAKKRAVNQGGG